VVPPLPTNQDLIDAGGSPFDGQARPLCDAKLVNLRDGQQAAPDFHFFTEAPVAGHIYGMVLDDTTNDRASPTTAGEVVERRNDNGTETMS